MRREPCPIPVGWTVRVYRIPEKQGLAICATREDGKEIYLALTVENDQSGPCELTLSNGELVSVDEVVNVNIDDEVRLAFLWSRCMQKMRDLEPCNADATSTRLPSCDSTTGGSGRASLLPAVLDMDNRFTMREYVEQYTRVLEAGYRATRWHHPVFGVSELMPCGDWKI